MTSSYVIFSDLNSLDEFGFIAGTTYTLYFTVYEADGVNLLDMGGATIKWTLSPYGQTDYNALELNGTITDVGKFKVDIPSSSTQSLSGKYVQQPVITAFTGEEYRPAQGVILILPQTPLSQV